MEGLTEMSDTEFAAWLRTIPREKSPEAVTTAEKLSDSRRGPYVPHHHRIYYGESRH